MKSRRLYNKIIRRELHLQKVLTNHVLFFMCLKHILCKGVGKLEPFFCKGNTDTTVVYNYGQLRVGS